MAKGVERDEPRPVQSRFQPQGGPHGFSQGAQTSGPSLERTLGGSRATPRLWKLPAREGTEWLSPLPRVTQPCLTPRPSHLTLHYAASTPRPWRVLAPWPAEGSDTGQAVKVPPHLVLDTEPANSASDVKKYGIVQRRTCASILLTLQSWGTPMPLTPSPVKWGGGRWAGAVLSGARSHGETPAVETPSVGEPLNSSFVLLGSCTRTCLLRGQLGGAITQVTVARNSRPAGLEP